MSVAATSSRVWSCDTLQEGVNHVSDEAAKLEQEEKELEFQIQAPLFFFHRVLDLKIFKGNSQHHVQSHCISHIHERKSPVKFLYNDKWSIWISTRFLPLEAMEAAKLASTAVTDQVPGFLSYAWLPYGGPKLPSK